MKMNTSTPIDSRVEDEQWSQLNNVHLKDDALKCHQTCPHRSSAMAIAENSYRKEFFEPGTSRVFQRV